LILCKTLEQSFAASSAYLVHDAILNGRTETCPANVRWYGMPQRTNATLVNCTCWSTASSKSV